MTLLFISFVAGVLTVLAPCILPLLPVIVGGSVAEGENKRKTYVIILSLIVSIVLFTLLLKWSTAFINIPQSFWTYFSGTILVVFAFTMIFPALWEKLPFVNRLSQSSNKLLGTGYQKKGIAGDIIMGAALGPVFSSCSPTYFVILATVLPVNFFTGLVYLFAYAVGLGLALLIIAILGQKIVGRLGKVSDPRGIFKKVIGIIFLIVGLAIITGFDKQVETSVINSGYFDVTKIETKLLQQTEESISDEDSDVEAESDSQAEEPNNVQTKSSTKSPSYLTYDQKAKKYKKYNEIVSPSGFVNIDGPITIGQYVGQKVIMIDFMTYTCINCQRTFPYLKTWYEKYEKDGFIIIAIHTPEFAFEKNIDNVRDAMKKFGLTFPVVLDNNYTTWGAYENRYWPHKYLIDIDGFIVYDHIGEGKYNETEDKIVELLQERSVRLGEEVEIDRGSTAKEVVINTHSPETYLGTARRSGFVNTSSGLCLTECTYERPTSLPINSLAFEGKWKNGSENITLKGSTGSIFYHFKASKVYLVMDGGGKTVAGTVYLDGKVIPSSLRGKDVDANGNISVSDARLYDLVNLGDTAGDHTIEIRFQNSGVNAFAFTFG